MAEPLSELLKILKLSKTGRTTEDLFIGESQWVPYGRLYGGQVLAQSVIAAMQTFDDERVIHSMHGYFLRPGDTDESITFSVDRIHDGRSFSTRRTQAFQHGLPILSMIASFQKPDTGLEHQLDFPADLPSPESIPTGAEFLAGLDNPVAQFWANERPFDIRHIPNPIYLSVEGPKVAHQAVWLKSVGPIGDDENLHRAALAYASDYTILESALRKHGVSWVTKGLKVASLDHAMWWHRFSRVDEWLLYVQESPSASGGRGLAQGRIFNQSGQLVASVAQEGMIRLG